MQQIYVKDALKFIPIGEADIVQYFGKIRNGKTYIATADIINLLNRGHVVYANWRVQWSGRDERSMWHFRLLGLLGLKRIYRAYPATNFKYLTINEDFINTFRSLTDCDVFLDEGHLVFNSYEMTHMKIEKQSAILFTGHFNRSIRIISQRTTNIHAQMRGNVNYFIQCEKVFSLGKLKLFRKTFYEDMVAGDNVDMDSPGKSKLYWGRSKIYKAYDSKYMRGDTPPSQIAGLEFWSIPWREQVAIVGKRLLRPITGRSRPTPPPLLPRGASVGKRGGKDEGGVMRRATRASTPPPTR